MKTFFKTFFITLLVLSVIFGSGIYFLLFHNEGLLGRAPTDGAVSMLDAKPVKERVNVLMLGIDNLNEENKSRTDTMMVLSVDPITNTAFMLSIPRDSRVTMKDYNTTEKINAAYSYGGSKASIKAVKELLNIPIHHYLVVDYDALFKTVDDVGGIDIEVPMDMKYDDEWSDPPLHIDLKKGMQHLNGYQAMGLVRYRKGYIDQDTSRMKVQQDFINVLAEKVLSPASVFRIGDYFDTVNNYVESDMTKSDLLSIAAAASQLDISKIEKALVPGESSMLGDIWYFFPNTKKLKSDLEFLLSGKYTYEHHKTAEDSKQKEKLKIALLNGNNSHESRSKAKAILDTEKYPLAFVGDAYYFDATHDKIYYKEEFYHANNVAKLLPGAELINHRYDYYEDYDLVIVIGNKGEGNAIPAESTSERPMESETGR